MSTGGGAKRNGEQGAIAEVLDHLLDPIEDLIPNGSTAAAEEATPEPELEPEPEPEPAPAAPRPVDPNLWLATEPIVVYGGRGSLRDFLARLRWSEQGRFRIPRLIARYALVVALFWSAIWLVLSAGGLR